jgi:hypothetical protein
MDATLPSETSVYTSSTQRHIPEDGTLHNYSYILERKLFEHQNVGDIMFLLFINFHFVTASVLEAGFFISGPGSIPGTTRKKSSGSGTGSIQPRDYN